MEFEIQTICENDYQILAKENNQTIGVLFYQILDLFEDLVNTYGGPIAEKICYDHKVNGECYYLSKILVNQNYQGQNIGSQLMEMFISEIQSSNIKISYLEVLPLFDSRSQNEQKYNKNEQRLINFYSKYNYKLVDSVYNIMLLDLN